jgi:hypothetical protein
MVLQNAVQSYVQPAVEFSLGRLTEQVIAFSSDFGYTGGRKDPMKGWS